MWKYFICASSFIFSMYSKNIEIISDINDLKDSYSHDLESAFKKNTDILQKLNNRIDQIEEQVKTIVPCECARARIIR